MSNVKVRTKALAKLREFRKGMDVESYLQDEFRQFLRALENLYVNVPEADLSADLYGVHVPSFSIGVVSIAPSVLKSGSLTNNRFFPAKIGKYWVDFGMQMTSGIAGTVTNNLVAKYSDGSTVHTLQIRVDSTIGGSKYVTGRCFMDLTPIKGAYFEFTGDANTVGFNFYCSFKKVG